MAVLSLAAVLISPEALPGVDDSLVRLTGNDQGVPSVEGASYQLQQPDGTVDKTNNAISAMVDEAERVVEESAVRTEADGSSDDAAASIAKAQRAIASSAALNNKRGNVLPMQLFSTSESSDPHHQPQLVEARSASKAKAKSGAVAQELVREKAQHIEHLKETFRSKEEQGHAKVVAERLKARRHYQQAKMRNELEVVSETSEVEQELPREIKGLVKHFGSNHALAGTKSHPFKEVELRHAGLQYNKLRKKVLGLTARLARLQEDASNSAAQAKFEEEQRKAKLAEQRLKEQDEDSLALANMPADVAHKLKSMQEELMKSKKKDFEEEWRKKLQHDEEAAKEVVKEDKDEIAEVKKQLHSLVGDKYFDETSAEEDSEASVLMSVPLGNDAPSGHRGANKSDGKLVVEDPTEAGVVQFLVQEVALLEKQQTHLVDALMKRARNQDRQNAGH